MNWKIKPDKPGEYLCETLNGDFSIDTWTGEIFQQRNSYRHVMGPLEVTWPAVKNFDVVEPGVLYRSAQPNKKQMSEIEDFGIKTVINLRHFHSDYGETKHTKLKTHHIIFGTLDPEERDVEAFLKIVRDENNWPCLVHCLHGSDRTGTMCAIFRIEECHWSVQEAIAEMTGKKYGFHNLFSHLPKFIRGRYPGKP